MIISPIAIVVKNPGLEFIEFMDKFKNSDIKNNPYLIIDDSSDDEKSIDLLYSNKAVDFEGRKILGVKGQYTIIKTPSNLGKLYRILFAMNSVFKLFPTAETCIIIDGPQQIEKEWQPGFISEYRNKKHLLPISMVSSSKTNKIHLFTNIFYKKLKKIGYFSTADIKGVGSIYMILQKISNSIGFSVLTI